MKLCAVRAEKTDSCLSYALKRIGLKLDNYPTHPELISGEMFEVLKFFGTPVEQGDILLWDKDVEENAFPLYITENGMVITKKIWRKFHVAVAEGHALYSDYDGTEIKLVDLYDKSFLSPDKILRRKNESTRAQSAR